MVKVKTDRDLEELERPESEVRLSFVTDILQSGLAIARKNLSSFASSPEYVTKMQLAFGDEIDTSELRTAWEKGDFSVIPDIEVRSQVELKGALGARVNASKIVAQETDKKAKIELEKLSCQRGKKKIIWQKIESKKVDFIDAV